MKFPNLISGILIQRYQRFLADIRLEDGTIVTAHCPNPGSMKTCSEPGRPVLIQPAENPKRKLKYTWKMIHMGKSWVGVDTNIPNQVVYQALVENQIPEITGYYEIKREVKYGKNSRIDVFLKNEKHKCFVEVKNVSMVENESALFPDAVTERGTKHLNELMNQVKKGNRAVMFYFVHREDCESFRPAESIDPVYADTLRKAFRGGVEILAYQVTLTPEEVYLNRKLSFEL